MNYVGLSELLEAIRFLGQKIKDLEGEQKQVKTILDNILLCLNKKKEIPKRKKWWQF